MIIQGLERSNLRTFKYIVSPRHSNSSKSATKNYYKYLFHLNFPRMNFIVYITFLSRRNADNGLPWIKPVQNVTIPMITDFRQRAKWTQRRRHLDECVALLRYSKSSRFILFSLSVLRSDEVTNGPLPRYLCLCFKLVRPRAKPFI